MSIKLPPSRYLINTPTSATPSIVVAGGIVSFPGLAGMPPVTVTAVESCNRYCTTACTAQVTTVTPTVPTTPCECPWTYYLTIRMRGDLSEQTNKVFGRTGTYDYTDPSGAVPTVNAIIVGMVAQINGDPYSQVTAAPVGTAGSYTAITLTEDDCSGNTEASTTGFSVTITQGTQSTNTPALPALNYWAVKRVFMEKPGYFAGIQEAPLENSNYCLYTMRVDLGLSAGPHMANERADRYAEFQFYVRNDGTNNFKLGWDTPFATAVTCFGSIL